MRYLLIEHTVVGYQDCRVTEYATTEEREKATAETILGETEGEDASEYLEELRETGWARFEGDPPLQWVDSI